MKRRGAIIATILAGAVSLSWVPGSAREEQPDFVIRSDVRLVLLDVSVKSSDGSFITGLSKNDFHVDENGTPQDITVFANNDVPVTVGLLVDNSRSMAPKRGEVLNAATAFIGASNSKDEIFVLNFNETVKRGLPDDILFSDSLLQLRAAIARDVPQGRTALNDAVIEGLKQLDLGKRDKKTLILISDGGDTCSQHTAKEMLQAVEGSVATIYTIGLFDDKDPDRNPALLKRLAKTTGGMAYFPQTPEELITACKGIAEDIRTRYTVGYHPTAANGGLLRKVRVHVAAAGRPHMTARTRGSYLYNAAAGEVDQ
jgi:VWFA-related protein